MRLLKRELSRSLSYGIEVSDFECSAMISFIDLARVGDWIDEFVGERGGLADSSRRD